MTETAARPGCRARSGARRSRPPSGSTRHRFSSSIGISSRFGTARSRPGQLSRLPSTRIEPPRVLHDRAEPVRAGLGRQPVGVVAQGRGRPGDHRSGVADHARPPRERIAGLLVRARSAASRLVGELHRPSASPPGARSLRSTAAPPLRHRASVWPDRDRADRLGTRRQRHGEDPRIGSTSLRPRRTVAIECSARDRELVATTIGPAALTSRPALGSGTSTVRRSGTGPRDETRSPRRHRRVRSLRDVGVNANTARCGVADHGIVFLARNRAVSVLITRPAATSRDVIK